MSIGPPSGRRRRQVGRVVGGGVGRSTRTQTTASCSHVRARFLGGAVERGGGSATSATAAAAVAASWSASASSLVRRRRRRRPVDHNTRGSLADDARGMGCWVLGVRKPPRPRIQCLGCDDIVSFSSPVCGPAGVRAAGRDGNARASRGRPSLCTRRTVYSHVVKRVSAGEGRVRMRPPRRKAARPLSMRAAWRRRARRDAGTAK